MPSPTRPRSVKRILLLSLAYVGLALFVWLSVQVYLSKRDPENYRAWDGPLAWIIGPPAAELERAARVRIEAGYAALEDRTFPPGERLRRFREELERAERLLIRSLRAQPAQARVLAALASVRYELDSSPSKFGEYLKIIELASSMAPTYPEVQRQLGELLLQMGRRDEAASYLSRSVELDPGLSRQVVTLMSDQLFEADEIRAALPAHPLVLAWLELPYYEEQRVAEYAELVASALDRGERHPELLARFANACERLGDAPRLLQTLETVGPLDEPAVEAERIKQLARAYRMNGQLDKAVEEARRATALQPEAPQHAEYLGDISRQAREHDGALEAYRRALNLFARAKAGGGTRARLYRKIGEVQEAAGHPDQAYDSYQRALDLNPGESYAAARVAAMERAAGFD